jgi:hypothetical protein
VPRIGFVVGEDDEELEALERAVLDQLDDAEDNEAPPGTRPLSAARRRRSLERAAGAVGGESGPHPCRTPGGPVKA